MKFKWRKWPQVAHLIESALVIIAFLAALILIFVEYTGISVGNFRSGRFGFGRGMLFAAAALGGYAYYINSSLCLCVELHQGWVVFHLPFGQRIRAERHDIAKIEDNAASGLTVKLRDRRGRLAISPAFADYHLLSSDLKRFMSGQPSNLMDT